MTGPASRPAEQSDTGAPVKVFWWKGVPNFGDALSALVVAQVSGRPVEHAGAAGCDLLAIGSLVQVMRRKFQTPRPGDRPWIWGAGLLHSCPSDFLDHVQIALLRGPVSAALLGLKMRQFGDPGLLADLLLKDLPPVGDHVVMVPHHTQMGSPVVQALVAKDPALRLVDPGLPPLEVARQIAGARHVVSGSLHGLVLADAFGRPSTWADPGTQSHLKYHDYAAGIGRALIAPLAWEDLPGRLAHLCEAPAGLAHAEGIAAARAALLNTFPAPLRAGNISPTSSEQARERAGQMT